LGRRLCVDLNILVKITVPDLSSLVDLPVDLNSLLNDRFDIVELLGEIGLSLEVFRWFVLFTSSHHLISLHLGN